MYNFENFANGSMEEVVIEPEDIKDLEERKLNQSQRMALGRKMKRFQHRLQRKRKLQLKRKADRSRLTKRSGKSARDTLKKRFSGGKKYSDLSSGMKNMISQRLEKKGTILQRLKKRGVKDKRKLDIARKK